MMTPEQINIACAEECGEITQEDWEFIKSQGKWWVDKEGVCFGTSGQYHGIPNYHSDANAALELFEVMRKEGWWIQFHTPPNTNVWMILLSKQNPDRLIASQNHSLPAAICECFLRVKGKWNESAG